MSFTSWLNESKNPDCDKEPVKFRNKPVAIEAIKWTGENFDAVKKFAGDHVKLEDDELVVVTLEDGKDKKTCFVASKGDFVIKVVQGEFYFCKPDIFKETYERE